jgi:hypothetical protein
MASRESTWLSLRTRQARELLAPLRWIEEVREVLFRILLACLRLPLVKAAYNGIGYAERQTLAGFPTFWPIVFHLLFSYSLIAFKRA